MATEEAAKQAKDFAAADALRKELTATRWTMLDRRGKPMSKKKTFSGTHAKTKAGFPVRSSSDSVIRNFRTTGRSLSLGAAAATTSYLL